MGIQFQENWLTRLLDHIFITEGGKAVLTGTAWDWILTLMISLTGIVLAMVRSSLIVDYTVYVFVFNRCLRRLVDYYIHQEFTPLNPISLTPLIVAGSMLLPVVLHWPRIPGAGRAVVGMLMLAMIYAFAVGFLRIQFAAVYALAESLAPLALFAFVFVLRPTEQIKDRWIRSFAWASILTSAYGWYQYLTIPPWDGFWLIETELYGYMGIPKPTQMTVFSTMAERGPLAGFLGFSVVPMIVAKKWRPMPGLLGWAGVVLVFSVILLTMSRAGLLFAGIGTVVYLFINRGSSARQIAMGVAVLTMAAWFGMDKIPNAERVIQRYETLGSMQDDLSYKGRLGIMQAGLETMLSNPFGLGLGSTGLATRINTGSMENKVEIIDAGYLDLPLTYGLPGAFLLLGALFFSWALLAERFRNPVTCDDHVRLARAMLITLIPASFAGDVLGSFTMLWLALGCGMTSMARHPSQPGRRPLPNQPPGRSRDLLWAPPRTGS
ncbi:MAG: O-Antigen ligase [Verrucomicrobia bacterium]|nr:MAG: O-Antigen ligase [Verrucomicrobiota bacterium]